MGKAEAYEDPHWKAIYLLGGCIALTVIVIWITAFTWKFLFGQPWMAEQVWSARVILIIVGALSIGWMAPYAIQVYTKEKEEETSRDNYRK